LVPALLLIDQPISSDSTDLFLYSRDTSIDLGWVLCEFPWCKLLATASAKFCTRSMPSSSSHVQCCALWCTSQRTGEMIIKEGLEIETDERKVKINLHEQLNRQRLHQQNTAGWLLTTSLPQWLRWLRHSAHRPGRSAGGAGIQSPGRPVDFVFGFHGRMLW